MAKYKQVFDQMVSQNNELFDSFDWVHKHYQENPIKWQRTFNEEGAKVLEVIRKYEDILCKQSESGGYGKFTTKLSEKFMEEIRKHFPKIDFIGIENT